MEKKVRGVSKEVREGNVLETMPLVKAVVEEEEKEEDGK